MKHLQHDTKHLQYYRKHVQHYKTVPTVYQSSKTVKNSQTGKMTIGIPIVTFLHRVRRIHKAVLLYVWSVKHWVNAAFLRSLWTCQTSWLRIYEYPLSALHQSTILRHSGTHTKPSSQNFSTFIVELFNRHHSLCIIARDAFKDRPILFTVRGSSPSCTKLRYSCGLKLLLQFTRSKH